MFSETDRMAQLSTGTTSTNYGSADNEYILLVIGKAGNGKSAVCNALVGDQVFKEGRSFAATTLTAESHTVTRGSMKIKVIDTPDITNIGMSDQQMRDEVTKWRQMTSPGPTAVLLTVRCDVRYTKEEHAIYLQIKKLWADNSLTDRLVVTFTFGDCQDGDLANDLKTVCSELKSVLADAQQTYVLFNKKQPSRSGLFFDIIEAQQRGKSAGLRKPTSVEEGLPLDGQPGRSRMSRRLCSVEMVSILLCMLAIAAIGCGVFFYIGTTIAGIGFAVFGGLVLVFLAVLLYCRKTGRVSI